MSRQGVILRKQHNQEGVPDPDDMYCEYYLMAKCGDHAISIPEEWTNCYEKTSNYGGFVPTVQDALRHGKCRAERRSLYSCHVNCSGSQTKILA